MVNKRYPAPLIPILMIIVFVILIIVSLNFYKYYDRKLEIDNLKDKNIAIHSALTKAKTECIRDHVAMDDCSSLSADANWVNCNNGLCWLVNVTAQDQYAFGAGVLVYVHDNQGRVIEYNRNIIMKP